MTTMADANTVYDLAGAAANLCAAYETLAATGYDAWGGEIRTLIDIIDAEIAWIRETEQVTAPKAKHRAWDPPKAF